MTNTKDKNSQVMLIILDGWGYREDSTDNAVAQARTPYFDNLWKMFPHALLEASGEAVGLPQGQMGNSEIGHTTIGAGKVIATDLVRIAQAINNDEFRKNPAFIELFSHVKKHQSTLHIVGLLSSGGVHSHEDHMLKFLHEAREAGIKKIAIHVFTDGRDTPPQSADQSLEKLESAIEKTGVGHIATISGRFYAMDRDNNWDRLERVEAAIFESKGTYSKNQKSSEYVRTMYAEGLKDELLPPTVFLDEHGAHPAIAKKDGVFFFNFRSDRARMLSSKLAAKANTDNIYYVTMTEYDKTVPTLAAFPTIEIKTTLAREISLAGLAQAHIAETEKFPHATYFLNGGKETPHENEKHIMLDSYKKSPQRKDLPFTHDLLPKMRAEAIADKAIEEINNGTHFIFINFANPDMVGHTANVPAIIEAVEEVDTQLGRIIRALEQNKGVAFITADHGNAEVNIDPATGERHTSHTTNPVPAILTLPEARLTSGTLADIAPTILKLLSLPVPPDMTGTSLF